MYTARMANTHDTDAASLESGLKCTEPTLTNQAQEEEANINNIVRNFGVTGRLPIVERPHLELFDEIFDYRTALHAIMDAQKSFESLDARVRSRFENDPAKFVDFCSDPSNLTELRSLGLADPEPAPPAVPDSPPPA